MDQAEHISVAKDDALQAALDHAAALNEPGTPEPELLRYLALVGSENLPEPYVEPTPERMQWAIDVLMKFSREHREMPPWRSDCGPFER
jgi:hypothetical protein